MTKKENQNRGPQVNFTTTVRRVLLTSLVFKIFFFKFGAIAVVSFSMQVVWMYLSQRRGGAETPTQHFTCRSLRKFSSRVHLLNKKEKKHFERKTELF